LYDLKNDPHVLKNFFGYPNAAAALAEMKAVLERLLSTTAGK
jgi:hypothetical protein